MEAGPGRGTLMQSLLTHLQTAHPTTYAHAQPLLIETSPALTRLQQQTLSQFPQCEWHHSPVPSHQSPIILIANELLDAFPHKQIVIQLNNQTQRSVTVTETGTFQLTPTDALTDEFSPSMQHWLQSLPQTLHAALFLDYGADTTKPTGDTLQAIHRHKKVDIFHRVGETDLTHHVNFRHVTQALATSHPHLEAQPLEHLAPFLMRHGLASLALQISPDASPPHPEQDTILHRLLHPSQMGTLFQVQCYLHTHP